MPKYPYSHVTVIQQSGELAVQRDGKFWTAKGKEISSESDQFWIQRSRIAGGT